MDSHSPKYMEPQREDAADPHRIATACIEGGRSGVLLDAPVIPPRLFDLSTGFLGELLHQLAKYGLPLAVVVLEPGRHSASFQDLMRESNRGTQVRFAGTREEAVEWLEQRLDRDP